MRRFLLTVTAVLAVAMFAAPALRAGTLEAARIFIEFNSTDQDVGAHVFLDADGWRVMKIFDPQGRKIFQVNATQALGEIGVSELFFEGEEPTLDELSLEEFFDRFPEGDYLFEGKTVDGELLRRRAHFSHRIPDGPVITSPGEGEEVDADHAEICWQPVTTPAGVQIAAYEVIIEGITDNFVKGTATCLAIAPGLLESGEEYGFEVLAIEKNHNQTITSGSFVTE